MWVLVASTSRAVEPSDFLGLVFSDLEICAVGEREMKMKALAVVATLAIVDATCPAAAVTLVGTASGTLSAGSSDVAGFFGPASTDLNGVSAQITFTFDTSSGLFDSVSASGITTDTIFGPSGNADVKINSISHSISAISSSFYAVSTINDLSASFLNPSFNNGLDSAGGIVHRGDGLITLPIDTPPSGNLCAGALSCDFVFLFVHLDDESASVTDAIGFLNANCFSFGTDCSSATAQTPLPAALPLFASGLGALGLLGWRRKRKNAAALAAA
jgi:hypothetical protein